MICNGEIYGFRKIKKELEERGYQFQSGSDCEVLLPLYEEYGLEMFSHLDAEYACVLYDHKSGKLIAAVTRSESVRCFMVIPRAERLHLPVRQRT